MASLQTDDIQGNIAAGFNTRFEAFVALAFRPDADRLRAARWLGDLAPRLTTIDDLQASREAMKDPAADPDPWLAVAIGPRVIDAVHPSVMLDDLDFNLGMARRKTAIGDETAPQGWIVGGTSTLVDALLIVAANNRTRVQKMADQLVQQATGQGFVLVYRELGERLPNEIEHFGFKDGISQPDIAGFRSLDGVQPGHFLFGYPKVPGGPPVTNQVDPLGLTQNGSLLVFRRLAQDVAAFRTFFDNERQRLLPHWPGLTAEHLAALVVGRWPSGAPVSVAVVADPGAGPNDNAFDFHDDLTAARCPFGAHIRKVNPRQGNRDVVDVPRLLRRGIPFGPGYDAKPLEQRGLLFVAYQASIRSQFVFISGAWMNTRDQPQAGGGDDLLVGRALGSRSLPINGPAGEIEVIFDQRNWIMPTGGVYLFAPGRRGLAMLSQQADPGSFAAVTAILTPGGKSGPFAAAETATDPSELDGCITAVRTGTIRVLREAEWRLTRLSPRAAGQLPFLHELQFLDLAGEHFPTQILDGPDVLRLAAQPGLEQLSVHAANLPPADLVPLLSRLPRLSGLDLRGLDISNEDLAAILKAHPDLTKLLVGLTTSDRGPHRFNSGRVSAGVGELLRPLRRLRFLSVRGLPVDDTSLRASHQVLAALEEFDGGETQLGDETARHLATQGRVRRLGLDRSQVTAAGIGPFAENPHLRDLDISSTSVGATAIDSLLAKDTLSRLVAAGTQLADDSLSCLERAESLTDLDLGQCGVGDKCAMAIAQLPRLERLSLASTAVSELGITALASSSLQMLDAAGLQLAPTALAALAHSRLTNLKLTLYEDHWIHLQPFTGSLSATAPVPRKSSLPTGLKSLALRGPVGPDLARQLSSLPVLEMLSLTENVDQLSAMVEQPFPRLRSFVAEGAGLDDLTVDLLGRLPNLEALFISNNDLSTSIVRLAAPCLHTLEIRNTRVDNRAIEALARLPRLHCLDLPGTRVTSEGVSVLIPAAKNLQSLALDESQFTDEVAKAIAGAPALIELYLYGPAVTDQTLHRLAPLQRLRELNLIDTSISEASAPVLAALTGLRSLRIFGRSLSPAFANFMAVTRPDVALFT